MNAMRVRLFVNPEDYTGNDADPNTCRTIEYIKPLCKRIKDAGFATMLDFHYSDTWADPAKQWTPKTWENLTDEQLYRENLRLHQGISCEPQGSRRKPRLHSTRQRNKLRHALGTLRLKQSQESLHGQ